MVSLFKYENSMHSQKSLSHKWNVIRVPHSSHQPLLNTFNILSLSDRRKINDLISFFKLLNVFFFCPELLSFFKYLCLQFRTILSIITTLYLNNQKTNYALSAPINIIMLSIFNVEQIDFFNFKLNSDKSFNSFVKQHFYYICFCDL